MRVLLIGHGTPDAEAVARLLEREADAAVGQVRTLAELDQALRALPRPDVAVTVHEDDGALSREAAARLGDFGVPVVVRADVVPARAADAYLRVGVAACVATNDLGALPRALARAITRRERARLAACRSVVVKMEGIRRLARRVAHDFNNIFGTVLTTAELMSQDLAGGAVRPEDVREIREHIKRAAAFARTLVTFAQPAAPAQLLALNEVVGGPVERLRQAVGSQIQIEVHLAGDLWPVLADPSQVEQIVTLLLDNARDALPDGGRVVVDTANIDLGGDDEAPGSDLAARFARLAVSDTGAGLDAVTRDRLFEPFFTTKQRPTALDRGLTTVYGLVRQAGGFVYGTGGPGQGATFMAYFPAAEAEPARRDQM